MTGDQIKHAIGGMRLEATNTDGTEVVIANELPTAEEWREGNVVFVTDSGCDCPNLIEATDAERVEVKVAKRLTKLCRPHFRRFIRKKSVDSIKTAERYADCPCGSGKKVKFCCGVK